MLKLSCLLPTYNEVKNISIVIWMLSNELQRFENMTWEIIVVDDNSPDGTQEKVKLLSQHFGEDKVLLRPRRKKLGLGTAYMHGVKHATGDYILILDADLSHHPRYVGDFIRALNLHDYDIVSGTRYGRSETGEIGGVAGWDFTRKLISRGANFVARCSLNLRVSDTTGSFRLYRKSVLEKLMPLCKGKGYVFQMEIIARAQQLGYSIGETQITFVDRIYGSSKLGPAEVKGFLLGLWFLLLTM